MKILVTAPQGKNFELHFPERILAQLRAMGEVELNPFSRPFTREDLKERLADAEIVVSHWERRRSTRSGSTASSRPRCSRMHPAERPSGT